MADGLTGWLHVGRRKSLASFNYASIGIGSAPHLGAEMFMSADKVSLTPVPYRGSSAQGISALIAGDVAMFFVGNSSAVFHVQAGTVRGFAVTSPTWINSLPDISTFAESGLPGVDNSIWFAVLAPSRTPPQIVQTARRYRQSGGRPRLPEYAC